MEEGWWILITVGARGLLGTVADAIPVLRLTAMALVMSQNFVKHMPDYLLFAGELPALYCITVYIIELIVGKYHFLPIVLQQTLLAISGETLLPGVVPGWC